MTIDEVINYFGSKAKVAKVLGISRPAITEWVGRGYVPLFQQYRIEKLTNGALKIEEDFNLKKKDN